MYTSKNKGQEIILNGSQGRLAATLVQPQSTDTLVILMHGICSHRNFSFLREVADALAAASIASLRFDFNGHGQSEGSFAKMTIENELLDAQAVLDEVSRWSWVKKIFLVGHSLGGVVAGLLAAKNENSISGIVQVAPAAVMHDDALAGKKRLFLFKKLSEAYLQAAREIDIYTRSCSYAGPVCLIHGKKDSIVPYRYSERYNECYPQAQLHLLEKENHLLLHDPSLITRLTVQFITNH